MRESEPTAIHAVRRRILGVPFAALVVTALLLAACGPSRETVTVTQRPDPIPSTEDAGIADEVQVQVRSPLDTVQASRFDRGKMWTFDAPPVDYFREAYGVTADRPWLKKARLGALRFGDGCSASFVSPNGLVMTNHHCGRDYITEVSASGENLLMGGFYAEALEDERRVPDLSVDQLIKMEDVTDQVRKQIPAGGSSGTESRDQVLERLEEQWNQEAKRKNDALTVEIVSLYNGAKFSKYTYRTYEDVRLVMAPELQMGFYGRSPDNFTYPRYALDMAFFRVYTGEEGTPLTPDAYFEWNLDGAEAGDAVFAVGNPGTTQRLNTVAQLKYQRDHQLPAQIDVLKTRAEILAPYVDENPEEADENGIRNTFFSLENSVKSMEGQLRGLRDPYLMARRAKAERNLLDSIRADASLQKDYGSVVEEIQQIQQSKRVVADKSAAFIAFSNVSLGSRILTRAIYGYYYDFLRTRGATAERIAEIRKDVQEARNWPADVEREFIVARLNELRDAFGPSHPTVQKLLRNRSPDDLAEMLVQESALMDSTAFENLLDEGYLSTKDPSVPIAKALAPLFLNTTQQMQGFNSTEESLNAKFSQARYDVYGSSIPPDATFTLRISDGVVKGYPYNGTEAPVFTNYYGLYDHFYSYADEEWGLPQRWADRPSDLDLGTPLNMVTTVDISGGSSGSALLNRDLEVVGLIFDSNIEALPNEYLYTTRTARAIAVDVRGMYEALKDVYQADRLVTELSTGRLASDDSDSTSSAGVPK